MGYPVEVTYRDVLCTDFKHLFKIEEESFGPNRRHRQHLKNCLKYKNINCLVALVDRKIIGYILFRISRSGKSVTVTSIAVSPAFRECQIGKNLLQRAELGALQEGASVFFASLAASNSTALHMFNRIGYQEFMGDCATAFESLEPEVKYADDIVYLRKMFLSGDQVIGPEEARHFIHPTDLVA